VKRHATHGPRPEPARRASQRSVRDALITPRARPLVKGPNLLGWLFVLLVIGLTEALVRLFDLGDSVPAPTATLGALVHEMRSGTLAGEIGATVESYAQGLAIAVVLGVTVGVLIGSSRTLLDASHLLIEFLRPIPVVSVIPLAVFFFGFGVPMRRWIVAYAALWPILMNALYGARGVDRVLHDVARTSGVGRLGRLVRVTLPAALPSIATGIRVSASIGLLVAVTAEWVSGTDGVGAYMQRQENAVQLPELYAAVVLVGALGYAVNRGLRATERRLVFWTGEQRLHEP
jgi:ABC-type nitrate/sulfonate/bicarbonate transport system permease component